MNQFGKSLSDELHLDDANLKSVSSPLTLVLSHSTKGLSKQNIQVRKNEPQSSVGGYELKPESLIGTSCNLGSTRLLSANLQWYEECIHGYGDNTLWSERQCAPGTLFNQYTGNCGKFDSSFLPLNGIFSDSS